MPIPSPHTRCRSERVNEETAPEFGLEPCALGRHDLIRIGDGHELIDGDGKQGEGDRELSAIDEFFQLIRASDPSDKVDPFARPWIVNGEDRLQKLVLKNADIELIDGAGTAGRLPGQLIPLTLHVHAG